jgi:NADH:ubiquinone oxidoreductase subunit E
MVKIQVCVGSACHIKGAYNVINALQDEVEQKKLHDRVAIEAVFCLGNCVNAVSVMVNEKEPVYSVSPDSVQDFFEKEILPVI